MTEKKKKAKASTDDGQKYLLRGIDREMYARAQARADREGREIKWLLIRALEKYADGATSIPIGK